MRHINSTKLGHFLKKLVFRNNLHQHHQFYTKLILTNLQLDEHSTNFDISNISSTFRLSNTFSKNSGETKVVRLSFLHIKKSKN